MEDKKENEIVQPNEHTEEVAVETIQQNIQSLIYVVRGQQVMMDSDLAMLYQVETSNLNKAMKRNINRFPEEFCFQLTKDEYENLIFQIGTSSSGNGNGHGGRRKLPYVYTESGIAMLSSVLHSEVAVQASIRIMKTFVEMRKYLANASYLYDRVNALEIKQSLYQDKTDQRLEQIFDYISAHEESEQKIFFDGQIYDAFSLIVSLIQKANKKIVLIDGYVDVGTLNLLSKKNDGVPVTLYTLTKTRLTEKDIENFNAQYPELTVKYTSAFHDRFLILDDETAYHIGASLKDAGKKCFAINHIQDEGIVRDILQRLELETEK